MLHDLSPSESGMYHHTLVIVFCDSLAVAKCDNRLHRLQLPGQRTPILPEASAEFTIGFPFARLYTEIPASIACYVGSIQCQRNVVEVALKKLNSPLHQIFGPSFSAGPILTSRYVAPASSCCFALFRIGSGSLSVKMPCLRAGAVVESLSPMANKFCHSFVLL